MTHVRIKDSGFTLVELVVALAIFTVVLGATAQALISYYSALDFQNQRNSALRNCAAVISQMREVRDDNPDDFPGAIIAEWQDNTTIDGAGTLPQETITVNYTDTNADPIEVTVRSQWVDLRGRPVAMSITTMLTGV
ncbi:MAG: type II secretion system protein [Candidatus Hydrogenedentes bacterium]|nr:type II secretion system protein [Candidatus Hydrogenedentota bacterium]